jgi:hypothetical protein
LTEIELPKKLKKIEEYAFCGCSALKEITLPKSVTSIGKEAFKDCSALTSIIVAEGNPTYDSRENCNAIIETDSNTLSAGCSQTTIPNSVTKIGEWAFSRCSALTSITIPEGVTSIKDYAFSDCKSLTSITFQGTIAQWNEIDFGNRWNDDIPAKFVHCTDGDVEI